AGLQQACRACGGLSALAGPFSPAPAVALDPFSPGLTPRGKDRRTLQAAAGDALGRLEAADAASAALYSGRRTVIAALAPSSAAPGASDKKKSAESLDNRLRQAAERGDAEELRQLAEQMPASPPATESSAEKQSASRTRFEAPPVLGEPFPQSSVERAGALGLEAVVSHVVPEVAATIRDFLDRYGWGPATSELGKASDGVTQLRAVARERISSREIADTAAETISLFATQVYINSAGLRYVAPPIDTAPCLLGGFAG